MKKVLIAPNKYVQGPEVLNNLDNLLEDFGKNIFIIMDPDIKSIVIDILNRGLKEKEKHIENFQGECSKKEIDRIKEKAENFDLILGIGGGKTLDTAKAVAHYLNMPVGIVPTIAATDAPCSALSVIYTEEGNFEEYLFLPSNPDIVIVDTKIIAEAPERFLISGMGDALATYFEARVCQKTNKQSIAGGTQTITANNLAKLCYDTLLKYGKIAKASVKNNSVTEALEKIVEANTLLSGLGFESGGLAAAHAIHNGFTVLEEVHDKTHGEKVAFSTIVQLILEDACPEEIERVINFCKEMGLPTTLKELGIEKIDENKIMKVAEKSCVEGETIHNLPFEVKPKMVKDAILTANHIGK
ncbi:MAG: glycerol dehydrogenase [Candidatus Mcinerneyibacterium aminivorans]|uniref:Glycerol dehydrogenase n=1 Tax=Candidatus Mcinerneyibacterium aminivorans TaxID=2703815 RepID=A0A5D0MDS1_9BACT|nr:MAG: glycerol dehydrogenase [Candidatus Mcinerneyibacterium aminivorans]